MKSSLKEVKEGELKYNNEDIMADFNTFFLAGVDTTSYYITMMIYLIAQHP